MKVELVFEKQNNYIWSSLSPTKVDNTTVILFLRTMDLGKVKEFAQGVPVTS